MNLAVDFISQVQKKREQRELPEYSKQATKDDDDELTEQDLYFISLAEKEYANGETISHKNINWD